MAMSSTEVEYVAAAGYHFIRDHISKGDIELHFVPTDLQLADIFIKPLVEPSFTRLVGELGNGYLRKGQKQSQHDKTEHGNGNSVKKSKSSQPVKGKKSTVKKSKSTKVKVKDGAETKEILNGPTRTHLI
ncbi:hypothetical protein Tco_1528485, partial [Tanacetum coccineum]